MGGGGGGGGGSEFRMTLFSPPQVLAVRGRSKTAESVESAD